MYTESWMKFSSRWRRLAWRLQQPTYATWVGSTVITLLVMRSVVSSAGPADTHQARIAADGSYARRKFGEVYDNPLYRLPENPAGGHRADGLNTWQARAKVFEHH